MTIAWNEAPSRRPLQGIPNQFLVLNKRIILFQIRIESANNRARSIYIPYFFWFYFNPKAPLEYWWDPFSCSLNSHDYPTIYKFRLENIYTRKTKPINIPIPVQAKVAKLKANKSSKGPSIEHRPSTNENMHCNNNIKIIVIHNLLASHN